MLSVDWNSVPLQLTLLLSLVVHIATTLHAAAREWAVHHRARARAGISIAANDKENLLDDDVADEKDVESSSSSTSSAAAALSDSDSSVDKPIASPSDNDNDNNSKEDEEQPKLLPENTLIVFD